MEGTLRLSPPSTTWTWTVVDVVVDTDGHSLATDISHCGLGSALGTSGASCLQSLGSVQVHATTTSTTTSRPRPRATGHGPRATTP